MCCRVYNLRDNFRAKDLLSPGLVEVDKPALLLLLYIGSSETPKQVRIPPITK